MQLTPLPCPMHTEQIVLIRPLAAPLKKNCG
uniref:Uncharacterized protein n=1 Tax=Arundo donax TaxID=35708 RepID=A0A0A8Z1V4_ARUDO